MAIFCTICNKNVTKIHKVLGGSYDEVREFHRNMHLYDAAAQSLIYLEDLISENKYRLKAAFENKDKIEHIVKILKKTLFMEPIFVEKQDEN